MFADVFPVRVFEGNMKSNSIRIEGASIFLGNVEADLLTVAPEDNGVYCLVLGNLLTKKMVYEGALHILGSLKIQDVFYFDGREWGAYIGGNIETGIFLEYAGPVKVGGTTIVKTPVRWSELSEGLAYQDEGNFRLDPTPLKNAIITGQNLLRPKP
jgi:hypothetical protein